MNTETILFEPQYVEIVKLCLQFKEFEQIKKKLLSENKKYILNKIREKCEMQYIEYLKNIFYEEKQQINKELKEEKSHILALIRKNNVINVVKKIDNIFSCFRCNDKYVKPDKKINCEHKYICNYCTLNICMCPKCNTEYS